MHKINEDVFKHKLFLSISALDYVIGLSEVVWKLEGDCGDLL